jgi:predicted GTPase
MAYGLCFLTETGTGKSIAINPLLIRFIMEIDDNRVAIVFDNDLRVTIDGTVASICDSLRKAMW